MVFYLIHTFFPVRERLCVYEMAKVFRWIWVMLQPGQDGQDGYVLGQSLIHFTNRGECVKAAKNWIKTANYDMCCVTRGPYLVVETLDGVNNWY